MISIRKSLSSKLSLGIVLLAVPIFVISLGLLFLQSRYIVRKEALGRAKSVLNTTTQRLNRHVNAVETATNANSWLALKNLHPDSLLEISHRLVTRNSHVDGCSISLEPYIFPQYGRHFSVYTVRGEDSITAVVEDEYEYFQKVWYKTPRDKGEACWVVYYDESDSLSLTIDGMVASYSKPLYRSAISSNDKKGGGAADRELVGVISTDLSLIHLSKIITSEKPFPHSYFIMIDKEGRYFIHPDSTKLFTQTIFSGMDPQLRSDIIVLGHEMIEGRIGSVNINVNGESCLVCYQPVPGTPWSLALISPDSDILKGYNQLSYILIPLLLVGLLVILILSRHAVSKTIRPLNHLLEQTQEIASGNYEVHISKSKRVDAVGQLQNSFAMMLQSLNFHMGIVRYSTEQAEQRNAELAKATQLVEEADRQKLAFIQNVTHQIRTPLNIIMGFSQVIDECGESLSEEELKSISDMMGHNSKLLSRMVLMLFDSSDTGITEELSNNSLKEDVSCNEAARESISYTNVHFPSLSVHFKTCLPDSFCIRAHRVYLIRSLRELLYNAAKYSDGKHISLQVDQTETAVRFVFEDKGPGMPEEYGDKIFKLFSKVNDLSEGLGLGLSLVKRHITNMGGTITLDTSYHEGCRFIIEMPKTTES